MTNNQDFLVASPLDQEPELNYNINENSQQGQGAITQENNFELEYIQSKIY